MSATWSGLTEAQRRAILADLTALGIELRCDAAVAKTEAMRTEKIRLAGHVDAIVSGLGDELPEALRRAAVADAIAEAATMVPGRQR